MKQFVALARVSSALQKREGTSLEEQESVLLAYAEREHGQIVKLFKIAETATKSGQRVVFSEFLNYVRKNAKQLSGMLFVKIDRSARNLKDWVELESIEEDYGVPLIFTSNPTANTPSGRLTRRMFASLAAHQTEQQILDIRAGHRRRVESGGLFCGSVPFGYRNARKDGRRTVEVDPTDAPKVKRIYELYAYHGRTLESLRERLAEEGISYTDSTPRFQMSQLHRVLSNRAYIGEVAYQGQWYPGTHEPLVTKETFARVQELLGGHIYRSHQMTYASELITCGHCGHPITGELKTKKSPRGERREYTYYRCVRYNSEGHPRVRLREAQLDDQVMTLFDKLQLKDQEIQQWFVDVIRARSAHAQAANAERLTELERQRSVVKGKQDRLLDLRLNGEVNSETYSRKSSELSDQAAHLRTQIESCDRNGEDVAALAIKAFELSQNLQSKWVNADYAEKRTILEIVCLNFSLDGVTLVPTIRKPFDLLAEGLVLAHIGGGGN